mgnify:CR=1 FL=1
MFTFDTKFLIGTCTDCNKYCVVFFTQALDCHIFSNPFAKFNFDTGLKDGIDIIVQTVFRQTVVRDTIAEHTAKFRQHLKYSCLVSHKLQIVSSTESSRATAYDSDTLSGGRCAFRWRNLAGIISRHTFQTTDIDRIIYDISAAACLTWMFTDETAGCRERIILADELNSIGITASANEGDVAGDVDLCRAQSHAGDHD